MSWDGNMLERATKFLEENFPERHRQLLEMKDSDPEMFRHRLRRMMPRLMRIIDTCDRSPEEGRLTLEAERLGLQISRLVDRYFSTDDATQLETVRTEIREAIAKQFDLQQQLKQLEVRRLERRLESIRVQLERNAEQRNQRIDRALEDLGLFEE